MNWQKIWNSIKGAFFVQEEEQPKPKRRARKQIPVPVEVIIKEESIEEPMPKPKVVEEPQKEIPSRCETCGKKFEGFADTFCCKYCGKYSCTEHFLPENHDCPNPDSPFNRWGRK